MPAIVSESMNRMAILELCLEAVKLTHQISIFHSVDRSEVDLSTLDNIVLEVYCFRLT